MNSEKDFITYAESGVNINANDTMVERIHRCVRSTYGPRVIEGKNAFAGLFRLDYDEKLFRKNYKNPVLVSCTDGVGTKIKIAQMMQRYDTVGIDLVAMSVNDMIVMGAEPLFFLDYLAVNKIEPEVIARMVEGVSAGCRLADCALLGGETAEMPDIYRRDEFDMAGFAVGVVEKNRLIRGKKVEKGDIIIGLESSGLHSNGYSLARNIVFNRLKLKVDDRPDELEGKTIGEALLEPTRIYSKSIVKLLGGYRRKKVVHAMANITGGGLTGNIPRVLSGKFNAVINRNAWPIPAVFRFLAENGPVEQEEMFRVFNMGIGYVIIAAPDFAGSIMKKLTRMGEKPNKIGRIAAGTGKVVYKNTG